MLRKGTWEQAGNCQGQQTSNKDVRDSSPLSMHDWSDNEDLSTKPQEQLFMLKGFCAKRMNFIVRIRDEDGIAFTASVETGHGILYLSKQARSREALSQFRVFGLSLCSICGRYSQVTQLQNLLHVFTCTVKVMLEFFIRLCMLSCLVGFRIILQLSCVSAEMFSQSRSQLGISQKG